MMKYVPMAAGIVGTVMLGGVPPPADEVVVVIASASGPEGDVCWAFPSDVVPLPQSCQSDEPGRVRKDSL